MAKSGVYRNCLPQLPKRATSIAMAKSTRPLKLVSSPPLKRIAQCPDTEIQARNAKRLRLLQDAERFNNSGMMYSIYSPGPQYLQSGPQPGHYYRHPTVNATPNIQGTGVLCCLKMGNQAFARGKENGCECCPNKLKRKFKGRDLKRRSPINKGKVRRCNKEAKNRNRPPFSYNNFLNTLEQAKKGSRMGPAPVPAPVKVGYNNGFIPLMTSTPTQTLPKPVFFASQPTEFSANFAETGTKSTVNSQETKETKLYSKDANTTEEIVTELVKDFDGSFGNLSNKAIADILDKLPDVKKDVMRNGGKVAPGKVMLPSSQMESDKSSQCSKDDNNNKKQKKTTRSKLPGMYPLGAPQAASSPIHPSKKRVFGACVKKFDYCSDKVVYPVIEARPLANVTNQRNCCTPSVWRPW